MGRDERNGLWWDEGRWDEWDDELRGQERQDRMEWDGGLMG